MKQLLPWSGLILLMAFGVSAALLFGDDPQPAKDTEQATVEAEPDALPVAEEKEVERLQAACAKLAKEHENDLAIEGKDGWLFLRAELRHIAAGKFWGGEAQKVSQASNPDWRDPLPVILDVHEQLKKRGIKLIVVPVPPKALVYADRLPDDAEAEDNGAFNPVKQRYDASHKSFLEKLQAEGISTIDLLPGFIQLRQENIAPYLRTDTHWSPAGIELAAKQISKIIEDEDWFGEVKKQPVEDTQFKQVTLDITGDLLSDSQREQAQMKERVAISQITGDQPTTDEQSTVLLMGDSHLLVLHAGGDMHTTRAGLAESFWEKTGLRVSQIAVRGSGATPVRMRLYRDRDALKGKKVVVWVFAAREFTETTGWRKLPVAR